MILEAKTAPALYAYLASAPYMPCILPALLFALTSLWKAAIPGIRGDSNIGSCKS
jgi:hypothetical protein